MVTEMATNAESDAPPMKYQSINQIDVPKGRDGKHKRIVTQLLSDLEQLEAGRARGSMAAESCGATASS